MRLAALASLLILLPATAQAQDYRLHHTHLAELPHHEPRLSLELEDESAELEYEATERLALRLRVKEADSRSALLRLSFNGSHLTVSAHIAGPR